MKILLWMVINMLIEQMMSVSHDYNLKKKIFTTDNYQLFANPRVGQGNVVYYVQLTFQMPTSVDETTEVLQIKLVMNLYWTDPRLAWDKTVYPMEQTSFITDQENDYGIWVPDNAIYFGPDERYDFSDWEQSRAIVNYKGEVSWPRVGILKQQSEFQVNLFPLDKIDLRIDLGSWCQKATELEIDLYQKDIQKAVSVDHSNSRNLQWKTTSLDYTREIQTWASGKYSVLMMQVQFQRTSAQGIFNSLIIPCTMNMILTILGFFIALNSPLRIYYTAENLMNIIFFMLMASSLSPITNINTIVELLFFDYLLFAYIICVMSMVSQWYNKIFGLVHNPNPPQETNPQLKQCQEKLDKLNLRIQQALDFHKAPQKQTLFQMSTISMLKNKKKNMKISEPVSKKEIISDKDDNNEEGEKKENDSPIITSQQASLQQTSSQQTSIQSATMKSSSKKISTLSTFSLETKPLFLTNDLSAVKQIDDDLFNQVDVSEDELNDSTDKLNKKNKKNKKVKAITHEEQKLIIHQQIAQKKFIFLKSTIFNPQIIDLVVYFLFFCVYAYFVYNSVVQFFQNL